MPFYEYECSNCKFYTEVMQKISDAPLTKCPSCGKEALKKLVSAPNFRLKGGGWYETDFKGDQENKRNLAGSEAEEASKPEAAAESPKTEAPKTEAPKPEVAATASASSKATSKVARGASSPPSKAGSGKRATPVKPSKAPTRVAASKARPAPAVRSKAKAASKGSARKKGRR